MPALGLLPARGKQQRQPPRHTATTASMQHFAFKTQAYQLMTVVLQAWTKLPLLGAFVSVQYVISPAHLPTSAHHGIPLTHQPGYPNPPHLSSPRLGPFTDIGYVEYYDQGGSPSAPIFWILAVALIINALFPAALLVSTNARSRRAIAVVDATLDMIYSAAFFLTMLLSAVFAAALPSSDPLQVISPSAHIIFVCRAIEASALDLKVRRRRALRSNDSGRGSSQRRGSTRTSMALTGQMESSLALPLWKGVHCAALALSAVAVALFVRCSDRYPLGAIPGPCAPCVCSDAFVLEGCPYHAELKESFYGLADEG